MSEEKKSKKSSGTQGRKWCFTSFLDKLDVKPYIDKIEYLIVQREKCPDTGKLHYQGQVVFKENTRRKAAQKYIGDPTAHMEITRNLDKSIEYCSKSTTRVSGPLEFGTRPKPKEQGKRNDLDALCKYIENYDGEKIKMRDLTDTFGHDVMAKFEKYILKVAAQSGKRIIVQVKKRTEMAWINIITAGTGTGKTTAIKSIDDQYVKDEKSKWWDGYTGEENVILNEWTNKGYVNLHELLAMSDHHAYPIQYKGGITQLLCKNIWITTNLTKAQIICQMDDTWKPALLRRIKWYTMKDYKMIELTDEIKEHKAELEFNGSKLCLKADVSNSVKTVLTSTSLVEQQITVSSEKTIDKGS